MPTFLQKIFLPLIASIIPQMSNEIKVVLNQAIIDLYTRAKSTQNPIDDVIIALIAGILNIKLPE